MSLIVIAGVAGGVAALGAIAAGLRWARGRARSAEVPQQIRPAAPSIPEASVDASFEALGFALGDVVMLRDTEAWLTGALRLTEGGDDEACLYFTDAGAQGGALLVRPPPRRGVFLVRAVELEELGLVPHTIEHEREIFTRSRRVPVEVTAHGLGCPEVRAEATWSWFGSPSESVVVVLEAGERCLTWKGEPIDESAMMRLAAGKATFRDE